MFVKKANYTNLLAFYTWLVLGIFSVSALPLQAKSYEVEKTELADVKVTVLAKGLEHPWGMAFLPDDKILVTERSGQLRLIVDGELDPKPVSGLPAISPHGQGGLLDVVLHPEFEKNRWVYLSYVSRNEQGWGTELARGKLKGHQLDDVEVLFRLQPKTPAGQHFGSRLVFDREGLIYMSLGDRGERFRAQDLKDTAGSVIRLNSDGSVPKNNPFTQNTAALAEIFSYGHRNIQGMARHPETGEVWTHEHGPRGGDELNVIQAGTNYGWPVISYGAEYFSGDAVGEGTEKAGMAQPVHYWVPSIAPSGMAFYTSDHFPQWKNHLFVGSLKFRLLVRLELKEGKVVHEERMFEKKLGRIRDVREGPDGLLYLLTDSPNGSLLRLSPAAE